MITKPPHAWHVFETFGMPIIDEDGVVAHPVAVSSSARAVMPAPAVEPSVTTAPVQVSARVEDVPAPAAPAAPALNGRSQADIVSNESLRGLIDTMIELSGLIKSQKAETKLLVSAHKELQESIKVHMMATGLRYIDLPNHQIHTYPRVRAHAMNAEFIAAGLKDFFAEKKVKTTKKTAVDAADFLEKRRKDKVGGATVWSTVLRKQKKKTEAPKSEHTSKKRKCNFVDADQADGGQEAKEADGFRITM